jgi:hypothetical protein
MQRKTGAASMCGALSLITTLIAATPCHSTGAIKYWGPEDQVGEPGPPGGGRTLVSHAVGPTSRSSIGSRRVTGVHLPKFLEFIATDLLAAATQM